MTTNSGVTETKKKNKLYHSSFITINALIILTPTDQGSLENIILQAFSQYNDQLHVEIYSLCCHYHECHQEEVLQQSSHHSTQGWNGSAVDGTYEHGIETQQCQAQVDQQLAMGRRA